MLVFALAGMLIVWNEWNSSSPLRRGTKQNRGDQSTHESAPGKAGLVEAMTLRYARVRDYDGNVHFVPNGTITTATNLSREYAYAVVDARVAYDADIDRALGVMREVASALRRDTAFASRIREDLEVAGVERWDDSAVVLRACVKASLLEQWNVKREFLRRLKYAFDAAGIGIPYPHLTVHVAGQLIGEERRG